MSLKRVTDISRHQIKTLITQNYLDFCLNYSLGDNQYSFVLDNGSHVNLLADGIIGFNLNTHETHTNGPASKSIVLSCAVHGNETAPIEICNLIIQKLLNEHLETSHRVLFIFANIPAIHQGKRFVDENLNRLFIKEQKNQSLEGFRAQEIMSHIDTFFQAASADKIHYDMHTAIRPSKHEKFAVYPFLHGKPYNKLQLAFLSACDVNTVLLSQSATGTFSYYTSVNYNADAFTLELGKVRAFGENDMTQFKLLKLKLAELITENDVSLPDYETCPLRLLTVNQVINKQKEDFSLHFEEDAPNFTTFSKGALIASESGKAYHAEFEGEAIVFPNAHVAVGQRALLTVIPYALQ